MATLTRGPADLVIETSNRNAVVCAGVEIGAANWQGAHCIAMTFERTEAKHAVGS